MAFPLGPAEVHTVAAYWTTVKNKTGHSNKTWNGKYMAVTAPQQILNPFWTGRARAPCLWQSNKFWSAKLAIAHPVFWETQRPSIIHCPSRLLVCPLGDPDVGILGKNAFLDTRKFS